MRLKRLKGIARNLLSINVTILDKLYDYHAPFNACKKFTTILFRLCLKD